MIYENGVAMKAAEGAAAAQVCGGTRDLCTPLPRALEDMEDNAGVLWVVWCRSAGWGRHKVFSLSGRGRCTAMSIMVH